jgi:hypothetical protein
MRCPCYTGFSRKFRRNDGDIVKAFIFDRYGKKERGRIGEMPDHPELLENDVLVQVSAAGVNLLDSEIRSNWAMCA